MKKVICLILFFGGVKISLAQKPGLLKPAPALPSSSGLSKFGDIPVDLHTGIAGVTIPLANINVSGFSVPISIGYHGGGIKTEDVASNVGLGWALSAGGQLNKLVVKYPDEGMTARGVSDTVAIIEDGFGNRLHRNSLDSSNWKYDNDDPDIFRATGPNLSCRFSNLVVQSPKEKIQVQRLSDTSFLLISTSGVKYRFGGKINALSNIRAIEDSSVYYLTQVELVSGQKINFEYEAVALDIVRSSGREFHYISKDNNNVKDVIDDGLSETWQSGKPSTIFRISNITYPGGKLDFLYGNVRKDLPGASMLTGVRQYDLNGNALMRATKEINFYQSYFECSSFDVRLNPNVDSKFRSLFYRLRLDSVAINGIAHPDLYAFEYNNTEMPEQGSLSQDHWGFYNGSPNQSLVAPYTMLRDSGTLFSRTVFSSFSNRLCNDSLAQAGILKKIIYPNGGSASFEYELNTTGTQFPGYKSYPDTAQMHQAFRQKLFPLTPGLSMGSRDMFAGTNFVVNSSSTVNGIKGETIMFYLTKAAKNEDVFVKFNLSPLAAGTANSNVLPFDTVLTIYAGQVTNSVYFSRFLPNGVYRIMSEKIPEPYGRGEAKSDMMVPVALSFSSGVSKIPQALTEGSPGNYPAGGLRIKKISTYDGIDHAKDIVKYFRYQKLEDSNISSGSFGKLPEYTENQATLYVPTSAFSALVGAQIEYYTFAEVFWDVFTIPDLDPNKPDSEVKFLNNTFKNRLLASPEYISAFGYGPVDFKVKMATGNKTAVKPVESYVGYSNVTVEYGQLSASGKTELTYYNKGEDWQRPIVLKEKTYRKSGNDFFPVTEKTSSYVINADWYYLQNNISKDFALEDTTKNLITQSYYSYATPFLAIPSRIILVNSVGDSAITETKVVADFPNITQTDNLSIGIKQLYTKNMLSLPVEKTTYSKNAAVRGGLTSIFTAYTSNIPYPETIFSSGIVSSATSFSAATVSNGAVTKSGLYQPEVKFTKYDDAGNLLEQQKQVGIPYAFIWGHNKRYLIAEASNAKSGQIFYTSFEEGGGVFDVNAKAGSQCYVGNYTTTFTPSPAPATPMKITYWVWKNNAWSFESKDYTTGMILSGEKFDDVRIYPQDTQMATYTYLPGIGILSKCDSNNKYQYYEYNAEGKLIAIRNNNRDLVQTIQYQPQVTY